MSAIEENACILAGAGWEVRLTAGNYEYDHRHSPRDTEGYATGPEDWRPVPVTERAVFHVIAQESARTSY